MLVYNLTLRSGQARYKAEDFTNWCKSKGLTMGHNFETRLAQLQDWLTEQYEAEGLGKVKVLDWETDDV